MGAQGTATLDFGAYPGGVSATVAVTGQGAFNAATSIAEAWQMPSIDTANRTVDEQIADSIDLFVSDFVSTTGFTIYGIARPGTGPRYGQFNVAWVWN